MFLRTSIALAALLAGGCLASTTLDRGQRAVTDGPDALVWRAATPAELPGLWRTISIEGAAAAVLLDVTYWIAEDGSFSGAALFAGPPPAYQVLSGSWRLDADGLFHLGEDAEPERAELSGDRLGLTGAEGSLVLEHAGIR